METTIKQPIVANEKGYYPLELFFLVEDNESYWATGKTIEEAQERIKKAKKRKSSKYFVNIFTITNPNISVEDAIKEILSDGRIMWQTKNTQGLGEYTIG